MKNDVIVALEELLQQQAACYHQLLDLSHRKTGVLVRRNARELEEIGEQEAGLISKVVNLEQDRLRVMQVLSAEMNVPLGELTLLQLSRRVSEDHAGVLGNLHKEILEVLEELRRTNAINNNLIEKELAFLNYSLDLLTNPNPQTAAYPDKKNEERGSSSSIFDVKA